MEYFHQANNDEHLNNISSQAIRDASASKDVLAVLEKMTTIFKSHNDLIEKKKYTDTLHSDHKAQFDQLVLDIEAIKKTTNTFPKVLDQLHLELKYLDVFVEQQKQIWPNEFSTIAQIIDKSATLSKHYEKLNGHQIWVLEFNL